MLGYSGYVKHCSYCVGFHTTWESAFELLKILAKEHKQNCFFIGEVIGLGIGKAWTLTDSETYRYDNKSKRWIKV